MSEPTSTTTPSQPQNSPDGASLPRPGSFRSTFSEWAVQPTAYGDAALREARLSFLDTLACMIAGAAEPQTVKTVRAMGSGGG